MLIYPKLIRGGLPQKRMFLDFQPENPSFWKQEKGGLNFGFGFRLLNYIFSSLFIDLEPMENLVTLKRLFYFFSFGHS